MRDQTPKSGDAIQARSWLSVFFIPIVCGFVAAADGFDTQVVGFTGPMMARDLGFANTQLGPVFAVGQFGGAVGAFLFGALADKFGKTRMLIVCLTIASTFTVLTIFAWDLTSLLVIRGLTGLGLGGAMPCFLGLGVQAMKPEVRRTGTAIMYAMFPAGGVIGGLISAQIIDDVGWKGIFLLSAAFAAIAIPVLFFISDPPTERSLNEKSPIKSLFADGRRGMTIWAWILFACATPAIVLLALWMPSLLQMLSVTPSEAGLLLGVMNVGAVAMSLMIGGLIQRYGAFNVLLPCFLGGALLWIAIALFHANFLALIALILFAGCLIGGAATGIITLVATIFPDEVRATAVGTALGFGKMGQVLMPLAISGVLAWSASPIISLFACAVPLLIAIVPLMMLTRVQRS